MKRNSSNERAKQAVASVANKQFKYLCTFLSLKYITLSFFKLCFFSFSRFQYFLRKKKKSLLALSLATSFFFPLLFLLPRIQLPLNMVLLYCFLSFFFFLGRNVDTKVAKDEVENDVIDTLATIFTLPL